MNRFLNIFKQKDEVCGNWSSEDGSGFSMVKGSWVLFKSDGTENTKVFLTEMMRLLIITPGNLHGKEPTKSKLK